MSSAEPPATSVVKIPPTNCCNAETNNDPSYRPDSFTCTQYLDVSQPNVLKKVLPVLCLSGSPVKVSQFLLSTDERTQRVQETPEKSGSFPSWGFVFIFLVFTQT